MKKSLLLTAVILLVIVAGCKKTTPGNNGAPQNYTGKWTLNGQPFGALSVLNPPIGELDFTCDSNSGEISWMTVAFISGSTPTTSGTIPLTSARIQVEPELRTSETSLYNLPYKSDRYSTQNITVTVNGNQTTVVIPSIWVYASRVSNSSIIDSFPFSANVTFVP